MNWRRSWSELEIYSFRVSHDANDKTITEKSFRDLCFRRKATQIYKLFSRIISRLDKLAKKFTHGGCRHDVKFDKKSNVDDDFLIWVQREMIHQLWRNVRLNNLCLERLFLFKFFSFLNWCRLFRSRRNNCWLWHELCQRFLAKIIFRWITGRSFFQAITFEVSRLSNLYVIRISN